MPHLVVLFVPLAQAFSKYSDNAEGRRHQTAFPVDRVQVGKKDCTHFDIFTGRTLILFNNLKKKKNL